MSKVKELDQQAIMNDMAVLIDNEIPECRQNLRDNHRNLSRVAEYCDTNYFRADNKSAAIEETKSYATQSLASVAYQVTSLAFNILHMLDLQATQLTALESKTNHLIQAEQIYREKIARREIGLFTSNKRPNRLPKIIYPLNPERPVKYVRKPFDYSELDHVGHGVKVEPSQQLQTQTLLNRTKSISSNQSINGGGSVHYGHGMSMSKLSASSVQPPSTKPPTPPQTIRSIGSLSKEYRNPALYIAPPQVPQPDNNAPEHYLEKVIVLYDYTKVKPDELNLRENAIIYVTKKNEDGWYEGVLDGEEGLFPCNYVETLRDY